MADRIVVETTSASERQWAAMAQHPGGAHRFVADGHGIEIYYGQKRDASPFVAGHAREAFNFNVSMFIYALVAIAIGIALGVFTVVTLGVGLLLTAPAALVLLLACGAVALLWLVCSIIAAAKAWNGEAYRYPLTLRLLD